MFSYQKNDGFVSQAAQFTMNFMLGGILTSSGKLVGQPLEVLKMRLQAGSSNATSLSAFKTWDNVWMTRGFQGLFAGSWMTVLRTFPSSGSRFAVFYLVYPWLPEGGFGAMLGGITSALVSTTLNEPFEIVRRRMMNHSTNIKLWDMIKTIHGESGWREFFRGYLVSWAGLSMLLGVQFPLAICSRRMFIDRRGRNPNGVESSLLGILSQCCAVGLTYPTDTVRSAIILHKKTLNQAIVETMQAQGIRGFYRGCGLNLVRMGPDGSGRSNGGVGNQLVPINRVVLSIEQLYILCIFLL